MPKIQPAPKKLYFAYTGGDGVTGYNAPTIDLSLAASIANRRFYRQGLNWAVANVKVLFPEGVTGSSKRVTVETIQDTWMTANAWTKSYKTWRKMNKEFALDENPSLRPKFYDYKILMNKQHYDDWKANVDDAGPGYQNAAVPALGTLAPRDGPSIGAAFIKGGEWVPSQFTAPQVGGAAIVDYKIWMHGADAVGTGVGLVQNYALSRSVPQSPDPQTGIATDNIFSAIFDEGTVQTEHVIDDILDDNDELPYDQDEYPGAAANFVGPQVVGFSYFTSTASNATGQEQEFNTGPFNAQCGLIQIDTSDIGVKQVLVEVTLVPGPTRGYLTQPMGDVQ